MATQGVLLLLFVISSALAQTYKVCLPSSTSSSTCQSLSRDDSQVTCLLVESRVDCALKLARGEADMGYFSEEEVLLLAQQQSTDSRVVASVRDASKMDPVAFESVAIVPSTHTGGLEGLRGGVYCHPGLDETDLRWSPRVLKTLEELAARTDRCPEANPAFKTAEELEVETLSQFFSSACRPGSWSANATVDAALKSRFPSLCSLCGTNSNCAAYSIDMGVAVAGVSNSNRHIQALECLRTSSNTTAAVAYVAWQHVKEFFTIRNPESAGGYSVLCPNGTLAPLSAEALAGTTSPCSFVSQPWGAIVTSTATADALLASLQTWWPNGAAPTASSWQSTLFTTVAGGANARVVFETAPLSIANYTSQARNVSAIDSTTSCLLARRWCTVSTQEQTKCSWLRAAAYSLGVQPRLECQQRASIIECLSEIRDNRADFISSPSNYGYLARQHYRLTPVKLVQNSQAATSRVAAFVKESSVLTNNITRFENLRGKRACFPEFGGLAYVSFVRAGRENGILSTTECDYAKIVGEFFGGACAPGAADASHALSESSSFDASVLCSACKPVIETIGNFSQTICSWDYDTNKYFGNNGSLACLADPENDVAFISTQNINSYLQAQNLQASQFRALCRNNTLAAYTGVTIDDGCLLAHVVDAEVVTRRDDPQYSALNALFDTLEKYFGYNAASGTQLINLEIFSPFDGTSDLLFKDTTIGLTEPTNSSSHEPARRYMELFSHLQACTGTAPPAVGQASRSFYAIVALVVMSIMTQFVIY